MGPLLKFKSFWMNLLTANVSASFSNRRARYRKDTAFFVVISSVSIEKDPTSSISHDEDGILDIIDGDENDDFNVSMVPFASSLFLIHRNS